MNKLASLEATLVWNNDRPNEWLTGVKCRATSVAKKMLMWPSQDIELLRQLKIYSIEEQRATVLVVAWYLAMCYIGQRFRAVFYVWLCSCRMRQVQGYKCLCDCHHWAGPMGCDVFLICCYMLLPSLALLSDIHLHHIWSSTSRSHLYSVVSKLASLDALGKINTPGFHI